MMVTTTKRKTGTKNCEQSHGTPQKPLKQPRFSDVSQSGNQTNNKIAVSCLRLRKQRQPTRFQGCALRLLPTMVRARKKVKKLDAHAREQEAITFYVFLFFRSPIDKISNFWVHIRCEGVVCPNELVWDKNMQ